MRVDEAIAEELSRRGVTAIFSLPASETLRLIVEANKRGIANYSTRHEQAAVGMADGYARLSGGVGVVLVGRGPGLTNGTNALLMAQKAGSRLLLIAGGNFGTAESAADARAAQLLSSKTVDQEAHLRALGIVVAALNSPDSAIADFCAAFELAASGVPVAVLVREDVRPREAGAAPARVELPTARVETPIALAAEDVTSVADLLGESWAARRPVILAGRGAVRSRAAADLRRLGESIGALLATSLQAKSMFVGDPYDVGVLGTMSSPTCSELVAESDLILSFGASLNPWTTMGGDLLAKARVIRVDADAAAPGRGNAADVELVADARLAAAQLADELVRRGHRATGYRTADVARRIADERPERSIRDCGKPGALDPRTVMIEIERALPSERNVVIDTGGLVYSAKYLSACDPESFVLAVDYGSVGAALGLALGAAVAQPRRTTVLAIGDGGYMMTLGDIDTAVRYRLPLVVVVMNNGGFGAEVNHLRLDGFPDDVGLYTNPPLDDVARALGADALALARPEDLQGLRARLADLRGPLVIDCRTTLDVARGSDLAHH